MIRLTIGWILVVIAEIMVAYALKITWFGQAKMDAFVSILMFIPCFVFVIAGLCLIGWQYWWLMIPSTFVMIDALRKLFS